MGQVWIRHPELDNAEAEIMEESLPVWLELGWVLRDDSSNEVPVETAETPAPEAAPSEPDTAPAEPESPADEGE